MRYLLIVLILIEVVFSNNIKVSAETRFIPFLHSLEKVQGIKFDIHERNSSLEAFEDIQNSQSEFAIVRGDILADNIESKNFFKSNAFQNYKLISKLNEKFSSYLYLFSKQHNKDAYSLLNSNAKIKKIGIGYLKDLSLIYLSAISKEVSSEYSFHYRSYSHLESLKRLNNGKLDACYLFTSQDFASKAQQAGFHLSSIKKPERIDTQNFGKLFKNPKVFTKANGGIRVENYLIASAQLVDGDLKSLIGALKKKKSLSTAVDIKFGTPDLRVGALSAKIEAEEAKAGAEKEEKEKECIDARDKAQELVSQQSFLQVYKNDATKKIKKVLVTIKKSEELNYFQPRVNPLLLTVNESAREASVIIQNIQNAQKDCDGTQVSININNLKLKIERIQRTRGELAIIESEILLKGQTNKNELLVKQEQELKVEERILEQEQRALQFELEKEARAKIEAEIKAKAEEASKGIIQKAFETIF